MSLRENKTEGSSLGHLPLGERWAFDQSVTDVFDDMLQRSIPQYKVMRRAIDDIGQNFVQRGTYIVDLGCSKGDALAPFVEAYGDENKYFGIDISEPMLEASRQRFADAINRNLMTISAMDLTKAYPVCDASLTLCILTLQFVPLHCRQSILEQAYRNTRPGGALLLVEKVSGESRKLDELMITLYHRLKSENGYSEEEISRKMKALEGVLIPLPAKQNQEMLYNAGFEETDCFWRWMNFAGYVAVRKK